MTNDTQCIELIPSTKEVESTNSNEFDIGSYCFLGIMILVFILTSICGGKQPPKSSHMKENDLGW